MACGIGKIFVAKHIMKSLLPKGGVIFYFVPWIILLEQFARYFNDYDVLIIPIYSKEKDFLKKEEDYIDTDIMDFNHFLDDKNFKEIKNKYKYIMFFCTYQSHQRLISNQDEKLIPSADLMICDEAHHATYEENKKNNFKNKENKINLFKSLHEKIKAKKILFMTATVKIFYKNRNKENFMDMKNTDIYGDIFYSLGLGEVIEEGILCDYEIISARFLDEKEIQKIYDELNNDYKKLLNQLSNKKYFKKNRRRRRLSI